MAFSSVGWDNPFELLAPTVCGNIYNKPILIHPVKYVNIELFI